MKKKLVAFVIVLAPMVTTMVFNKVHPGWIVANILWFALVVVSLKLRQRQCNTRAQTLDKNLPGLKECPLYTTFIVFRTKVSSYHCCELTDVKLRTLTSNFLAIARKALTHYISFGLIMVSSIMKVSLNLYFSAHGKYLLSTISNICKSQQTSQQELSLIV